MVTNTVLKTYLENGTHKFEISCDIIEKFSNVGCITKKRGGYKNNSSSGLNALIMIYATGRNINVPHINRNKNNTKLPKKERFIFL